MSNTNAFVIENGVLENYDGPGGDVTIPESVTSIGYDAFYGCSSLTSVTIPESVTSIGNCAFWYCSCLASIMIPDSVSSIGDSAFFGCSSLTSVTIPDRVTSIGDSAFFGCSSLTSVTIPDSVTSIGDSAFFGCSSLTSITIPDSVTSIGDSSFEGCSSLTSITIPDSVTSIGDSSFKGCSSLTSVTIPDSVTSIGKSAFLGCHHVSFVISDQAANKPENFMIENEVLIKYIGLGGDVVIPAGVTSIGYDAFFGCSSLTSVTIPEGVISIGVNAFSWCRSLTSVTIPDSVTSIGARAFSWCSSLTSVTIPEGVTSIGDRTFEYCSSLTSVTIPDSVTSFGESAFEGCSNLNNITIPDSATSIGDSAFKGCSSLTSITIPDSVTSIGKSAFLGCHHVSFVISDQAANKPENFMIENEVLIKYIGLGGDVVIPAGVASIGYDAFFGCSSLISVTIPDSVTSIGVNAFSWCSRLTSVTIPDSVTSIGARAFSWCSSLTSVTIPEGVTSIGDRTFEDCSSLTSATIPDSVTSFGESAFEGCSSLRSLTIQNPKCTFGKEPFGLGNTFPMGLKDQISSLYLHMTDGSLKQYILQEELWESLTPAQQAEIFLSRQSKSLTPGYLNCMTKNQLVPLHEAIMTRLDADKPSSKDCTAAVNFMTMFKDKVSAETLQAIHAKLLPLKTAEKALKNIESDLVLKEKLGKKLTVNSNLPPAEKLVMEKMIAEKQSPKDMETKLKSFYNLSFSSLPAVRHKDGENAEPYVLAWLLMAHETVVQRWWGSPETTARYAEPGLCPEAAEVAAMLNAEDLQNAINTLADTNLIVYQNTKKKFLSYPICRYADETTMKKLTKRAPSWCTSVSGNEASPLLQLRDAVKYSNTRAAMLFAERYNELDKYAAVRGMTVDEVRDQHLSDVGLDEQGGKAYDLGNQTVTARLQTDLSFLFELPNGKTAKSLPKKGADEQKYNVAKADFDEMRKAAKKILKSRCTVLFEDFLNGRTRKNEDWQEAYLKNPLLRRAASLLVWAQGKATFTLTADGVIDSAGQPYALTGESVFLAHPMEMKPEETKAWQRHFTARGLKQPFAQVWEPVIDPTTIKEDRYSGSVQPMYRFSGKDRHGIHSGNLHAYSEDIGFTLDGCNLEYTASTWRISFDGADETYTLGMFTFEKYTRKVNHIVGLLDKWTAEDRVKKDDISVMDLMDTFTLAQITEFITAAQEAKAMNVLAALLDYKNAHFADFDPMDEFTLEW